MPASGEHPGDSRLLDVSVPRGHEPQVSILHHHERDTIGQAPIRVWPCRVSRQSALKECPIDRHDGNILRRAMSFSEDGSRYAFLSRVNSKVSELAKGEAN